MKKKTQKELCIVAKQLRDIVKQFPLNQSVVIAINGITDSKGFKIVDYFPQSDILINGPHPVEKCGCSICTAVRKTADKLRDGLTEKDYLHGVQLTKLNLDGACNCPECLPKKKR